MPLLEMYSKDLVRGGELKPERVTAETAEWDDAPEAIAGHRSKLMITRSG